jgi:hypothetical protein
MSSKKITLEKIIGDENQIKVLYQLLKNRKHNISNTSLPTIISHIKFVKNHPYRAWYLIKSNGNYIGSTYVHESNCIGISLVSDFSNFPIIVELISKKNKPLKEIKSVRPSNFYINIAPNNKKIESQLNKMGANKIQSTYSLPSIKITSQKFK